MTHPTETTISKPWWQLRLSVGIAGVFFAIMCYYLVPSEEYPDAPIMMGIIVLMAIWWVFEVIPIPVTSLLPIVLFPLFGLSTVAETGTYYGRPIIFLFLGGFILALGLQESGIHKRIALKVVSFIGSSPAKLILGFMIASGFLSMWISNTASVMVMLPIGLSILEGIQEQNKDEHLILKFGLCMMLGIAYAADIGGMATLIGTPPNLIFTEMYAQLFPDAPVIGFMDWMMIGLPLSLVFMGTGWFVLTHFIFKFPKQQLLNKEDGIQKQLDQLGPMRRDEKWAGIIFLITAILWMTASDIELGSRFTIYGWRSIFGLEMVSDSSVAIAMASLLFLIPSKKKKGKPLLSWKRANRLPWGILFLFGGGFAIAGGFQMSGLSNLVESLFSTLPALHPLIILTIVCVFVTFLTELTSNSAITNLILPILATASVVLDTDPRLLMIPATLSASCAFMMPIASPTQAIVFGSGYVKIQQMMRTGIWFNIIGIVLIVFLFSFVSTYVWNI